MTSERRRRLAAVWFADIVGYSELSSQDVDGALAVVDELQRLARREVESNDGRVVKLVGDAVLAVFDGADAAVGAALAVLEGSHAVPKFAGAGLFLRIGLHVGDVVESDHGEAGGGAVQSARAIAALGRPGQVVLSGVAYQLLRDRAGLEFRDLGELEVADLPDPVRLYAVSRVDERGQPDLRALLQERLAPLQLLDVAGIGGMGEIYLARDAALHRTLAVKVLRSELARDQEARQRFFREAQVIAGLSHPNVIAIHSVGELDDGTPYFVMDYVEGGSLADRLEHEGPISVPETRRILGEVASALEAAHARGVVHRDIKASNILYDPESGRALVTDWGIAALDATVELSPDVRLTRTGMVVGSPQYMSPEQLAGDDVGPETDLYSLGLLAFELLTGHGPFPGETPRALMVAHLSEDAPRLSELRTEVDPELEAVVARCLDKIPRTRPSAQDVARRFAPGSGTLLEWPPPGLQGLEGAALGVERWLGGSISALFALLILMALVPSDLLENPVLLALLAMLVIGVVGTGLRGLALTTGALMAVRRGMTLGYESGTILELLMDRRGDGGYLISGSREYAGLDAETRSRLRQNRLMGGALRLAASTLIGVPFGIFALLLLSRGSVPPVTAAAVGLLPTLLMDLLAARLLRREDRAVAGVRRAIRERKKMEAGVRPLVGPWKNTLADAETASPLPDAGRGARWVAAFTGVVVSVLLLLAAVVGGSTFTVSWVLAGIVRSNVPNLVLARERYTRTLQSRDLRLPTDSSISPREAAELVWSMPATDFTDECDPELAERTPLARSRALACLDHTVVFQRPAEGLTLEERAHVARYVQQPAIPQLARIARAPGYDMPLDLQNEVPEGEEAWLTYFEILDVSVPRLTGFREAAYVKVAEAGLLYDEGRVVEAETAVREVYSAGLLMLEDGRTLIEALVGHVVAGIGLEGLRQLYELTDRENEARALEALLSPPQSPDEPLAELRSRREVTPSDRLEEFSVLMRDTTAPPGTRWEPLGWLVTLAQCGGPREVFRGLPAELTSELEEVRSDLVRTAADARFFQAIVDGVQRAHERTRLAFPEGVEGVRVPDSAFLRWLAVPIELTAALLDNPRIDGCFWLVASR